jgi:ankyrin repeat protein
LIVSAGALDATRVSHTSDPHAEFLEAAVWHGSLDDANAILAANPRIATESMYAAAVLGDNTAIRRFLAQDPPSATAKGGPHGWDALTYLCFSKYLRLEPARTDGFVDGATALLDAGADPNTGFFSPEHQPNAEWETALYAAAGVAHHPELTKLLVDRGANPNDVEVGYHAPETLDNRALKVLVESGKLTQATFRMMLSRKMNWHDKSGVTLLLDHGADANYPGHRGRRPLQDALAHGCPFDYFELLLDRGADPTLVDDAGRSVMAGAARMARVDVLELFQRRGYEGPLEGDDAFLAACARADEATARRLMAADPEILGRVQSRDPTLLIEFAGADNAPAVRLLLDLGFDIDAVRTNPNWMRGLTALHEAAGHCRLETVRLLIARGAPLGARHEGSGRTPADVALLSITEQSEWTPHASSVPIARALLDAGGPFNEASMTLAAALCLERTGDVERLTRSAERDDKQIALAAAAFNGHVEGLRRVIAMGVELDAMQPGLEHAAALHNAVSSGRLEAVRTLAEAGARLDIRDLAYRLTPLDWAKWYADQAVRGGEARDYAEIEAYLRRRSSSD